MRALPLYHRIAGRPVIVLGDGDAAEAKRRLVIRAGGSVVTADDSEAKLAFIAMVAPEAVAEALRARGILVNVADRPDLCDFTLPSLLDRDPVLIAIGTGGASAGLAKHLRLRLERLLPATLGQLATGLFNRREALRRRWPDAAERRRTLDHALAEGGVLDPFADGAAGRLEPWLAEERGAPIPLPAEFLVTSDDPDDLTVRQARLLGSADAVMIGPDIAPAILDRARADALRVPLDAPLPAGSVVILRRA